MSEHTSIEGAAGIQLLPIDGSVTDLARALQAEGLPIDDLTEDIGSFFRIDRRLLRI